MKKTICYALLTAILVFSGFSSAYAESTVIVSHQKLIVNGQAVNCEKYNIEDYNYFKLRDIAYVLNGTGSQFSVGWSDINKTVSIKCGEAYVPDGSELTNYGDQSTTAKPSDATIEIDGSVVTGLSVYSIGGNNYFKLRDLGIALGFIVDYDARTNTMLVQSTKTVHVSTSEEFLNAIAPNTKLILSAGTYNLTKVDKEKVSNKYVWWGKVLDGEEVIISGVSNLSISGGTDTASALVCVEPRFANALNFSGCSNIVVKMLTVGHTLQEAYCTGGVLHFYAGSKNISIASCDLYGCGTYGIVAENVSGINVGNTIIRDCSYGAICCISVSSMIFEACSIYDCKEFAIVDLCDCNNVSFARCLISNNTSASEWHSFFSFLRCNSVSVKNCTISKNTMESLVYADGCSNISFTDNLSQNNKMSYGVFAKDSDTNVKFFPAIK